MYVGMCQQKGCSFERSVCSRKFSLGQRRAFLGVCVCTTSFSSQSQNFYMTFTIPQPDVLLPKVLVSCSTLSVSSCHATRRRHEGWDTARSPKSRQGKSSGKGRVRTIGLPVSKLAL
ncbi:hypothetical protein T265_05001 [Opisthorchis viverrini]|uniref:Uncharacterized protein n=1 Tax=Opisthorchis viverrini TaxID=6198 RepID=A0A074ZXL4_OPIVI|nr:hypothetical protein T265_05001 [Opisthorchis viverrini]KER28090.1 hypothetical protein T265_05001 [Opisthorchis viverrini]